MTRDAALLNEIWSIIKPNTEVNSRQETANSLVELFDEYGMLDGNEHESDFDKEVALAMHDYFDLEDEEDSDDYA